MIAGQMAGSGLSSQAVNGILGGVSDALTAAGTVQADALELKFTSLHFVSTAAAGTGVRIPAGMNPGEGMELFNGGANACLIYPPVGGTINNVAANGSFSVATLKSAVIRCINPLKFFVMLGA